MPIFIKPHNYKPLEKLTENLLRGSHIIFWVNIWIDTSTKIDTPF